MNTQGCGGCIAGVRHNRQGVFYKSEKLGQGNENFFFLFPNWTLIAYSLYIHKELRKIVGKKIVLVIAGNKMDLVKQRQVDEEEAVEYAKSVGAIHMPCSAKTGKGVEEAFLELTKGMLKGKGDANPAAASDYQGKSRTFVQITEDNVAPKKSGGCC